MQLRLNGRCRAAMSRVAKHASSNKRHGGLKDPARQNLSVADDDDYLWRQRTDLSIDCRSLIRAGCKMEHSLSGKRHFNRWRLNSLVAPNGLSGCVTIAAS